MTPRWVLAAAVVAAASVAGAEVRLVRGDARDPELIVQPVAGGTWSPRGEADPSVINPLGDFIGDGDPVDALNPTGSLLAAWGRPANSTLVLLHASRHGHVQHELPASLAGEPRVVALPDHWLVAWTDGGASPSVILAEVWDDGAEPPEVVLPGVLVGHVRVGDSLHLVSYLESSDELLVLTLFRIWDPSPVPLPQPIRRVELRLSTTSMPELRVTGGRRGDDSPWAPCIQPLGDTAVVAWSAADHQVGSILLDEAGVVAEPTFERGPSGSCTAVLNAATRR